jgi:hypothetical protein
MPVLRFVVAIASLGLLAACSPDYSAIRAWSDQAREIVEPSRDEALPAPAGLDRRDAVSALREAASAWLGTLALLAEDGFLRERENPLTLVAARATSIDAEGGAAVLDLGEAMADAARRIWRAPDLASAVERGDTSFQALMAALGRQIDALARETPDPRAQAAARYAALLADRPTGGTRAAMEELRAMRDEALLRRERSDAAQRAAVTRIAEGHALLKARQSRISQAETARLVRAQEAELRRLARLIEER